MNNIIQFINARIPLEQKTKEKIFSLCTEKRYKKGEPILKMGSYCHNLFMLSDGLAKLSFDTDDGEFIMRFFQENILFTDLESLTLNKPTKYQFIALEDSTCTIISHANFQRLFREEPKMAFFYIKFLTIAHINMLNRVSEMLESNASVRYNNFLIENPELINRIKLGDLSKYLGINQVTLSRIRKKK